MNRDAAINELQRLVEMPGILQIITGWHACGCAGAEPETDEEKEACEKYEYSVKDPRHFHCHDVVRIDLVEKPNDPVIAVAFSGEYEAPDGRTTHDECRGVPEAVLPRLLESLAILGKPPIPPGAF